MSKLDNSLKLLKILMEHDIVSSKALVDKLNVTDRQLRSYIISLKNAGFDIGSKSGLNGGYFISSDKCPLCYKKIN